MPLQRRVHVDTETTGLYFDKGDRIIEIGAVETIGNIETGNRFHTYVNPYPQRVHEEAFRVHGISTESLLDKPKFRHVYREFLDFIEDSPVVIHNAPFDMGFLNGELARINSSVITNEIIDTLAMARRKYPNQRVSLDALCLKLQVDNSDRTLHGALIDANLLAQVYIKMVELDRLDLISEETGQEDMSNKSDNAVERIKRHSRGLIYPTEAETSAHELFIAKISDPVWKNQ